MLELTPDNHGHYYELTSDIPVEELEKVPLDTQITIGIREHIFIQGGVVLCVKRCAEHVKWMIPKEHSCPDPCENCEYRELELDIDESGMPTAAHHGD